MEKIYLFLSKTINRIFFVLFFLTLYFAIDSPNIIIGDNPKYGQSTTVVSTLFIVIGILSFIFYLTFDKIKKFILYIFSEYKYVTAIVMFVIVIILQIFFVYYTHPEVGWDAGALHEVIENNRSGYNPELVGYFSSNTNNLPIVILMYKLSIFFGKTSWIFFDYITLLLVDLSAILNIVSVAIIDKKKVPIAIYAHVIFLLLFPSIIIPYTDTWVMPLVSGMLICYFLLIKKNFNILFNSLTIIILGILAVGTYHIKPSAIVPVIAMIIIEVLSMLRTKKVRVSKRVVILMSFFLISSFATQRFIKYQVNNQTIINVIKGREIPAIHFVSMGISGDGGYNPDDALKMSVLQTKKERIEYSKDKLVERLKKLGPFGYIEFLLKKHSNNTSDGTFGWGKEGEFFKESKVLSNKSISDKIKNYIYLYGTHIEDLRYLSQVFYIILLLVIFLGGDKNNKDILFFKIGILGGFFYLLIFEGGRSRYLIQFFPIFLLLFILSFSNSISRVKDFFTWKDIEKV
jgi:conserved hypothetical integral membrane protein